MEPTFDTVLDRFIEDERLLEIKQLRPGDRSQAEGELSYATVTSYLSVIKQVRLKWGSMRLTRIKPVQVQEWLKKMDAAPKTKGHVKALMHRVYEKAMLWEMVEWQRNPESHATGRDQRHQQTPQETDRSDRRAVLPAPGTDSRCPIARWWSRAPAFGPKRCWRLSGTTSALSSEEPRFQSLTNSVPLMGPTDPRS